MWRTICHSAIGSFHVETGLPCQDYGTYHKLGQGVLIGAVADGAGSAKCSDVGAKIAVETAIQLIIDIDRNPAQQKVLAENSSYQELSAIFKRFFPTLLAEVQKQLKAKAAESQEDIKEFASTLIVFVATSNWLAAMQLGDGFIVVRQAGGNYQLLFQPDKGEYINETTFVTASDAVQQMQVKVMAEPAEFICAATDGVEKVSIDFAQWQPFPPFFKPLDRYLQETETPLQADLQEFLDREDLKTRTTDDKTLLLAHWANRESQ